MGQGGGRARGTPGSSAQAQALAQLAADKSTPQGRRELGSGTTAAGSSTQWAVKVWGHSSRSIENRRPAAPAKSEEVLGGKGYFATPYAMDIPYQRASAGRPPASHARGGGAPEASSLSTKLATDYLASLLQRQAPGPLPRPSEGLSAFQTRDLLQGRSAMLGRLRGSEVAGGEALLGVAQQAAAWQLRQREAATAAQGGGSAGAGAGAAARPATASQPARAREDYAALVAQVVRSEVDKARADSQAWVAHRATEVQASEERILGRRRPQTVYFERPSTMASSLFPQLLTFPARQGSAATTPAAGAAAATTEESLDAIAHSQDAFPAATAATASAQPAEHAPDADGVVAAPWRPVQHKRLTIPVVLSKPATASSSSSSSSSLPAQSPLRPVRRETMLAHWRASSSSGAGEAPAYTAQAAAVLHAAPRLLEHFTTQSAADASATVKAAARFKVGVAPSSAEEGSSSNSSSSSSTPSFLSTALAVQPPLPALEVISRALRPITAHHSEGSSSSRGDGSASGEAAPAPKGGKAAAAAAPPAPVEGELPPTFQLPLFTGGLYGQHPLDREAELADLRDRFLKDLAKASKKSGAAAAPKKK